VARSAALGYALAAVCGAIVGGVIGGLIGSSKHATEGQNRGYLTVIDGGMGSCCGRRLSCDALRNLAALQTCRTPGAPLQFAPRPKRHDPAPLLAGHSSRRLGGRRRRATSGALPMRHGSAPLWRMHPKGEKRRHSPSPSHVTSSKRRVRVIARTSETGCEDERGAPRCEKSASLSWCLKGEAATPYAAPSPSHVASTNGGCCMNPCLGTRLRTGYGAASAL